MNTKLIAVTALAVGLGVGSYGIASAASGGGSSSSSGLSGAVPSTAQQSPPAAPQGWGHQRSDETVLTGDTAAKVIAAAKAKEPNATVVRAETDADGNALYEVHMTKADGSPVTVYVDKSFGVVSVQDGMPAPPQGHAPTA